MIKNPSANAEDTRDDGSIPGSGRSPGVGNGNPLQYSCLETFQRQRSLSGYIVQVVAKSKTILSLCVCTRSDKHTHTPTHTEEIPESSLTISTI